MVIHSINRRSQAKAPVRQRASDARLKRPIKKIINKSKAKNKARRSPRKVHIFDNFRFLELAPELRNSIYEYALAEDEPIEVNETLKEPGLLQVCSQIRGEATGIWYRDNTFVAEVREGDASMLNEWAAHCCDVGQRDYFDVGITLIGHPDWASLTRWARAVWKDDRARILAETEDMQAWEKIICRALRIAVDYKGLPWSFCKTELQSLESKDPYGRKYVMVGDDSEYDSDDGVGDDDYDEGDDCDDSGTYGDRH